MRTFKFTVSALCVVALLMLALPAGAQNVGIIGRSDHTEDTAHVDGEYLSLVGAVRDDGGGPLCGTDNDVCPLSTDATGNLYVTVGAGVAGAGAAVVEDAGHVDGEDGSGMMCRRIDVLATSTGTSGDWGTCNQDATGQMYIVAADSDALLTTIDTDTSNIATDTDSLAVVGGGAEATALRVTIASDSTGVVTTDNATISVVGGGAEATAQRVTLASDSTGILTVDSLQLPAALGPGVEAGAALVTIATDSTGVLTVDSLQLPAALGPGAEAGAALVTIATDSTGVLSVDDNAVNLSVDFGGTVPDLTAGAAGAGTQRVILATDDPAVTDLAAIELTQDAIVVDMAQLEIALEPKGSIVCGQTDVPGTGTAVNLAANACATGVTLGCEGVSTGDCYIRHSAGNGVTGGMSLPDGGPNVFIPVSNTNLLWVDVTTNGDDVGWCCY